MSYRMSQRDYVILTTYMFDESLLQFVIHLDVLRTHDTMILGYYALLKLNRNIYFSLVRNDFNSFNLFSTEVLTLSSHTPLFQFVVRLLILST